VNAFYDVFERHDHASGLKAQSTHYCAGCGHGLAHKYLARAIEELGIQDRTIAVSSVGCSVFLYYYFDVGNTQAAHGRAPAVALGHKLANPDSVVVSYQGDGDLASIGLSEIMHVAQLGVPLSVVFVNNAIYGMTGGQLAPTTLQGQKTTTSPDGRDHWNGQPLKMAELIAQLDGSVYVERVALYDAKQRVRAQKAIKKALRIQAENKGFAFVEVLAECPTHLRLTPKEAETWVRDRMVPVYPLGVKKDAVPEQWGAWRTPSFDGEAILDAIGAVATPPPRFCPDWSAGSASGEVGLKLAGAGGDGAQTAALLVARAAINEGLDATHIPSYGPESRGGTSYADVRVARTEVLSPDVVTPDVLVAFNAPSAAKFASQVVPGGVVLYDSSVILHPPAAPPGVRMVGVPASGIARQLGQPIVKNTVALGALQAVTRLFPAETFLTAIRQMLEGKGKAVALNEEAFRRGGAAVTAD
jgi:2-oxoisovalerate ferredoxin oxidoreductase beta subunit